jgi:hypothetical protein
MRTDDEKAHLADIKRLMAEYSVRMHDAAVADDDIAVLRADRAWRLLRNRRRRLEPDAPRFNQFATEDWSESGRRDRY